jgi:hypothetical protein
LDVHRARITFDTERDRAKPACGTVILLNGNATFALLGELSSPGARIHLVHGPAIMESHMSLASTIKKTGKKIGNAISGTATAEEDMDILDKLKQEHEEVSELLSQLVSSERPGERKSLLGQIKAALVPHVRAEEKVVYDAVIALREKQSKQDGYEGYLEHGLADKMLAALSKIDNAMSPEFSAAAKVLKEVVEHHVEEEERNVWSDVKKNFSSDQRIDMNRRFEMAKSKVRLPS